MASGLNVLPVEAIFQQCFASDFRTRLVGGAVEPLYLPETEASFAEIHYRHDYQRSALHEVAHWCLAGPQRRQLDDYGYWYLPVRNAAQQAAFEAVEARPQALEALFAEAAGVDFRVSSDDVASLPSSAFKARVAAERRLIQQRLPVRAKRFLAALNDANSSIVQGASGAVNG